MAQAVLRRYTPPTCTLEIMATGSALSRWTDRAVLKNLRFRLSLDDPTLPEEEQVTVEGDRIELEALCDRIESYVQRLLSRSSDLSPITHLQSATEASSLATVQAIDSPELEAAAVETGIQVQPKSSLSHELHLGTLATEESGETVPLSTLQLFDLANALDEYQAEAVSLPALGRPVWLRSPVGWAGIAAAALLAVGVTGAIAKFVMDVSSPSMQTASVTREAKTSLDQNTTPTPVAIPTPPTNTPPSLSLTPLPPPAPPAGAIQPAPSLPSVAVNQQPVPVAPVPAPPVTIQPAPAPAPAPRVAIVPPAPATSESSRITTTEIPELAAISPESSTAANTAPNTATLRAGNSAADQAPSSTSSPTPASQAGSAPSETAARNTAFDAIPQVAEVRQYFRENWKPPAGLTQTLEYRLVLNADGSLQRIVPLGQAAATYLDRTSMPLMGEAFVSPTENSGNPQIRLVLRPDGNVQTFLEYAR
ncbi:MAG TPA: DUF4335 domain-containing protein [Trichocoleus sp.]